MGKILKTPQSKAQAKPRQIMQPAKAILNDQDTYFKFLIFFLGAFEIHNIISNLLTYNANMVYISAAVGLALQVGCVMIWRKKKFRYLTPLLMILAQSMFNWCHLEVLRGDYDAHSSQYIALEAAPMAVVNLITIQNLTHSIYKIIAIILWILFSLIVSYDPEIRELIVLTFIMLAFVFINFMLVRKRTDHAINNEYKLSKACEKLKGLLDVYVNDSIVVADVQLKKSLFSNICFQKIFEKREIFAGPGHYEHNEEIRTLFGKIQVKEEGARKDEMVYLWELLDALRENSATDAYETVTQLQMDNGEYMTFSVKISQCFWDSVRAFVLVFTDISQKETVKQLKANEETQNHLMDIFAHELRTPIKNILGALGLLVKDIPSDKKEVRENPHMKYLYICQLSCKYLQSICNSYLDVARLKHSSLKINVHSFSLRKMLQEVKDMLECQTMEKGLNFELEVLNDVPDKVVNDRDKLEEILLNLLSNAIKFTVSGFVKIQAKLDNVFPDSIEISVIDSGPGIGHSDRSRLFRQFTAVQASLRNASNPDGVGLGLSISQKLTKALAETDDTRGIRVESMVGRGTKFTFSITSYRKSENYFIDFHPPMLPDEKVDQSMSINGPQKVKTVQRQPKLLNKTGLGSSPNFEPPTPLPDLYVEKTNSVLNSVNPTSFHDGTLDHHAIGIGLGLGGLAAGCDTPMAVTTRACVLVVDDNPVDLMLICDHLEALRIPYRTALGGEACLDQVDEAVRVGQPFRGILLDCYMPDLNGFQTAKILKARMKRREIPEIPIIAISAHDNPENREKAYKAGMGAWYTKPIQEQDVREMLDTSFGKTWRMKTDFA